MSCSTKIPSDEELANKTHLPKEFNNANLHNIKSAESSVDSTNPTKNTQEKNKDFQEKNKDFIADFFALINDENLHLLLEIALKQNTNVLIMSSRINQAAATAKINTAAMLPTINGGINSNFIDRHTQSQFTQIRSGTNSVNASVSMNWELDLFGKLNALRQSAKKNFEAAQSNLAFAQLSLLAEVSTMYFTMQDNAQKIATARQTLSNLQEIDEINEYKLKAGLIDLNTFRTSKATLTTQANNLEMLLNSQEQNKNALLILLNVEKLPESIRLDSTNELNLPNIADYDINKLPNEVILKRFDVLSAIKSYHSQLYRATNASAARLPSISLSGSIGDVLYSTMNATSLIYQIANSISMPLLNRTNLNQNLKIQKELASESFYTLQNTINTALGEIENALFNKNAIIKQVLNNKNLYELSQSSIKADELRLKNGMIDKAMYLSNENAFLSAKSQYETSQINEILAHITLFKALGGNVLIDSIKKEKQNEYK